MRDFKGIWIPKEVWLNKELSIMEKVFMVEIDSLDSYQECFASNNHFAEFFGLSKSRKTNTNTLLNNKTIKTNNNTDVILKGDKDKPKTKKPQFTPPTTDELIQVFRDTATKYNWNFDYILEADSFFEYLKNPKCKWKCWKTAAINWAKRLKQNNKYWQMNRGVQSNPDAAKAAVKREEARMCKLLKGSRII